jgi:hypothetical protein
VSHTLLLNAFGPSFSGLRLSPPPPIVMSTPTWVPHVVLGLCILIPPSGPDYTLGVPDGCLNDSGGEEAIPTMRGSMAAFYQPAIERPELKIETSAQRWREHFACCVVMMSRMSFSWWYTLSTPSAEGAGKVSRSVAAATTFWLALGKARSCIPSWMMVAETSLARVQAAVRSTVRLRSASSVDLRWCSSVSRSSMVARSLGG